MTENASPLCPSLFFCEPCQTRPQFRRVKTLPLLQVQQGLGSEGIAPLFCTKPDTVTRGLQITGCCLENQHVTWVGASVGERTGRGGAEGEVFHGSRRCALVTSEHL